MPEIRGRKDGNPTRSRPRPAKPEAPTEFGEEILDDGTTPVQEPNLDNQEHIGFDEETNNRYEEIKRGETHISELQQMTMAQLLKVAKEESLSDYSGLKKQDLIFKILKERVKQNGLMFGEGTLETLPDGFGFLRSPDYNRILKKIGRAHV